MSALARLVVAPDRQTRRLSVQSLLFATGSGAFLTASAVFFTRVVGLTATQVSLGYSLDALMVLIFAGRLGRFADLIGPKRAWATAAALEGLVFLTYPLVRGFAVFLAYMVAVGLLSAAAGSARAGYTFSIAEAANRVTMQAYLRTAFNLGLTLGSLLGSAALLAPSTRLIAMVPAVTGILLLANGFFITRLPGGPVAPRSTGGGAAAMDRPGFGWRAMLISGANGVLTSHQTILNVTLPLWLVTRTAAPPGLLGLLFLGNTFLAILLQVRLSRWVDGLTDAVRANVFSAALIAVACLLFAAAQGGGAIGASALLLVGCVVLTLAEIYQSAASWGLVSNLAPPGRRSAFQGLIQQGSSLESVLGPAAFTFLALQWGVAGWGVVIVVVLVAGLVLRLALRDQSTVESVRLSE